MLSAWLPVMDNILALETILSKEEISFQHADTLYLLSYVLTVSIDLRYVGSIQKYMSCKGGCLASVGTDQPAEVVYDAPKYMVIIFL